MVFVEILRRLKRLGGLPGLPLSAACLLLCCSCTAYRECVFETAVPAAHTLKGGRKIGFLDRQSYQPAKDTLVLLDGAELGIGSGRMAVAFRNGFYTRYAESYPLDSLPVVVAAVKQSEQDTALEVLPPPDVVRVCREHGWDYLLSWESFHYTLDSLKHSVNGHVLVRLYAGQDGEALSSRWFTEEFAACFSAGNDFYGEEEMTAACVQGLMWDRGYWYAQEWVPGWRKAGRRIYVAPKTVGMGTFYCQQGDRERASEIWQAAASGKPKTALRACLNLALLCEWEEDFEGAISWLKKGREVAENGASGDAAYLEVYLREVETRLKNRPSLEEQLF